mgnify:CR=1 FL=1
MALESQNFIESGGIFTEHKNKISKENGLENSFFKKAADKITQEFKKHFFKSKDHLEQISSEVQDLELSVEMDGLREEAEQIAESTLNKISEQLGTNRGGWYENTDTNEKYYIKFYENFDQARAEFIANAIYDKLGINAAKSKFTNVEGEHAIASSEVLGAEGVYHDELKQSADVKNGFIADAYLANWDVVGLVYDNIVKSSDGKMYRIDNGGALTFRAQGQAKEFSPNDIPELENMMNLDYPTGQVFSGLSMQELKLQAQHLVDTLKQKDINKIIAESGMEGDQAEIIREGLIGRLKFIQEQFKVSPAEIKYSEQVQ